MNNREEAWKLLTDGTTATMVVKNGKYRIVFDNHKRYETKFFGNLPEAVAQCKKVFSAMPGKALSNPSIGTGSESAYAL